MVARRRQPVRARPFVITEARQLHALAAPVRQAIVDAIVAAGPSSVADLAASLGRPANALYHHLRQLERVGLLVRESARDSGGRPAVVYDVPGRPMSIAYAPDDRRTHAPMKKLVGAMARSAEREFARGHVRDAVVAGPRRELWAGRWEAWLAPKELEEVNRLLARLAEIAHGASSAERARDAKHVGLTFVLAPLGSRD